MSSNIMLKISSRECNFNTGLKLHNWKKNIIKGDFKVSAIDDTIICNKDGDYGIVFTGAIKEPFTSIVKVIISLNDDAIANINIDGNVQAIFAGAITVKAGDRITFKSESDTMFDTKGSCSFIINKTE